MNALELHQIWKKKFKQTFNEDYSVHGFIGNETHFLKQLQIRYDDYSLLLAMETAMSSYGVPSVRQFCESIDKYVPDTKYSKYVYLVRQFGKEKEKALLQELLFLENKWLIRAEDIAAESQIVNELEKWLEESSIIVE